jgi:hypothetical protein
VSKVTEPRVLKSDCMAVPDEFVVDVAVTLVNVFTFTTPPG